MRERCAHSFGLKIIAVFTEMGKTEAVDRGLVNSAALSHGQLKISVRWPGTTEG